MKKLVIEKVKKFDHIIGKEFKHEYAVNDKADLEYYIDEIYGDMDGEQTDYHEEELNDIHALKNGDYSIDQGDFIVNVEIAEGE